jgi:DUF2075 family protein
MNRSFYSSTIADFLQSANHTLLGTLAHNNTFELGEAQKLAWEYQIEALKPILKEYYGSIYFEFLIPRMGRRIDVVLVIRNIIFLLEFKVGEKVFLNSAIEQVYDYALDLKNFHETSHDKLLVPIVIATESSLVKMELPFIIDPDRIIHPIKSNTSLLSDVISKVLQSYEGEDLNCEQWTKGRYLPTPTIIEAATALYNGHSVEDILKRDATAINLSNTTKHIEEIISRSKRNSEKAICFITGVPGAGKTLVGLDIATKHLNANDGYGCTFLSGNAPLVAILREALTRDRVKTERFKGIRIRKGKVYSIVKVLIQNVHHFRDEYLKNDSQAPQDHIAIFDEAQRAWNLEKTIDFVKRKNKIIGFNQSEPEFLISCLDRHEDWGVVICLVGGGQEINTGEAGISEWISSITRSYPHWNVYISNQLFDTEYAAGESLNLLSKHKNLTVLRDLHLSVSMRSFRAEHLSSFVKFVLDNEADKAKHFFNLIKIKYPLVISRDLSKAKNWIYRKARGSERYGMVVSSKAQRLKPYAIDVKTQIDPVHWFLDGKEDVRSSYYMEDVATEFQIQGLELDWACVVWDGDFRYSTSGWQTFSFVGDKWKKVNKEERKQYLKNAYRVLLTRARQGMVIVVPEGDPKDPTRDAAYYDSTYNYLVKMGIECL